jgi:hypothetical protein
MSMLTYEDVVAELDRLLDVNEGEPEGWPLPEKLRLLAAQFDADDLEVGETCHDVQRDLRHAATIIETCLAGTRTPPRRLL